MTRTLRLARVTAVYSNSLVRMGEAAGGSRIVTASYWLPWLRCTVSACAELTAASRDRGSSRGVVAAGNAARRPSGVCTTTPVSPL